MAICAWTLELLANDFDQSSFLAPPVEFTVEDLFPRSEVEFAGGHSYNNFTAHYLPFHVCVGVVFAGSIVVVAVHWLISWA